jgi:hypothetical protein
MHDTEGETIEDVKRERDELSRTVAAMAGALVDIADSEDEHGKPCSAAWMSRLRCRAILESPAVFAEQRKWVPRKDFDDLASAAYAANQRTFDALDERDAAVAEAWRLVAIETRATSAERERDELSRTVAACVEHIDVVERILGDHEEEGGVFIPRADLPKRFSHRDGDYLAVTHTVSAGTYAKRVDERDAAIRERDELGIQLEALRERMQLAMAVVEAARRWQTIDTKLKPALDAFDTVPGDEK